MVRLSALVAVAFAVITGPATAQQSHINIRSVEDPRLCLTEGAWNDIGGGDVFVYWCEGRYGSLAQRWQSWEGGWTRNVASGRCLGTDGYFRPSSVHTWWCAPTLGHWRMRRQVWRHWQGGWKQRQPYHDLNGFFYAAGCLSRLAGDPWNVTESPCVNPITGDHPRKRWTWEFVPGT